MRTLLTIACVVLATVLPANAEGETGHRERLKLKHACEGSILVVGAEKDAKPYAELLGVAGFTVTVRAFDVPDLEEAAAKADLVVLAPGLPIPQQNRSQPPDHTLEKLHAKRIVAMGESGANALDGLHLLIGGMSCWSVEGGPAQVAIPKGREGTPFASILESPCAIDAARDEEGWTEVTLCRAPGSCEHRESYDAGKFPEGTLGIGRSTQSLHHWGIAKQGDYLLWGPGCAAGALSFDGERLFVNVCDAMLHAKHEEVVFPAKTMLQVGKTSAKLIGGCRDKYCVVPKKAGKFRLQVRWEASWALTALLFTPSDEGDDRKDGTSPLEMEWEVSTTDVDKEFRVEVMSYTLPEGEEVPYTLVLEER